LPEKYDIDYLIFSLSDGDITRQAEVEEYTRGEAVKWLMLRKYESYMTDRATKHG